jgi:hypothetical protein
MYHPIPLNDIDRYYAEFVKVGHALGGTDLPATKAETLDCLRSYLPRLALTHGAALATGVALMDNPDVPQAVKFFDWAIRDLMPDWAAEMVMYRPCCDMGGHQRHAGGDGAVARVPAGPAASRPRDRLRPHRTGLHAGQRPGAKPGHRRADALTAAQIQWCGFSKLATRVDLL